MEAYVAKGEMMKAAQLGSKALAAVRTHLLLALLVPRVLCAHVADVQDAIPSLGLLKRVLAASAGAADKNAGVATFKLIQAAGWTPDLEAYLSLVECAVGAYPQY